MILYQGNKKKRGFLLLEIFVILTLISISFVSADFGYDNENLPRLENPNITSINFSIMNHSNSTDYWITDEGIKKNVIDILFSELSWIFADTWNYISGGEFTFNETLLNDTIDNKIAALSVEYNATSIINITGIVDDGDLNSTFLCSDGDTYNVSEVTGANGLQIQVNFTDVIAFNLLHFTGQYIGGSGHTINLEFWNPTTKLWEVVNSPVTDQSSLVSEVVSIFGGSTYIDGGNVSFRFFHNENGIVIHDYILECIHLVQQTGVSFSGDHDALIGRNSIENHPWALPTNGSLRNADNINITDYLIVGTNLTVDTNAFFVDTNNGTKVGIGTTTPGTALHINDTETTIRLDSTGSSGNLWDVVAGGGGNLFAGVFGLRNFNGLTWSTPFLITNTGIVSITEKLGIGTTNPGNIFEIYTNATSDHIRMKNPTVPNGKIWAFSSENSGQFSLIDRTNNKRRFTIEGDNDFNFIDSDGTTSNLFLKDGGNVGIGTTSPAKLLTLKTGEFLGWEYSTASGTAFHHIRGGNNIPMTFVVEPYSPGTDDKVYSFNGRSEIMTMLNNGNVGINTNGSVQRKLHVNGSILSNSTINATIDVCIEGGTCLSSVGGGVSKNTTGFYLYNDTTTIYFNDTLNNITINNLILTNNNSVNNYIVDNNASVNNNIVARFTELVSFGYYNITDFDIADYLLISNWNATNTSYALDSDLTNGSYFNVAETDPLWSANYTNLLSDCSAGNYSYGFFENGTQKCRSDVSGGGDHNHDQTLNTTDSPTFNNLTLTGNLTLSEKITFTFGEIIDNIVDGWIRITGSLFVTQNLNVTNNITTGDYFIGNGSQLTDISASDSNWNANWTAYNTTWSSTFNQTQNDSITNTFGNYYTKTESDTINTSNNNYIADNNASVNNNIVAIDTATNDSMKNYVDGTFRTLSNNSFTTNVNVTSSNNITIGNVGGRYCLNWDCSSNIYNNGTHSIWN